MKRVLQLLVVLFALGVLLPNLLIWTPSGKRLLASWIADRADAQVSVEDIRGFLPFYLDLKGVHIEKANEQLEIATVSIRLSPADLLTGWLTIKSFEADGLVATSPRLKQPLPKISLSATGSTRWRAVRWNADLTFRDAEGQSRASLQGTQLHTLSITADEASDGFFSRHLQLPKHPDFKLKADLRPDLPTQSVHAFFRWEAIDQEMQACGELNYTLNGDLDVRSIHVQSPLGEAEGKGILDSTMLLRNTELSVKLHALERVPESGCCGALAAHIMADGPVTHPSLRLKFTSDNLIVGKYSLAGISLDGSYSDNGGHIDFSGQLAGRSLVAQAQVHRLHDRIHIEYGRIIYGRQHFELTAGYTFQDHHLWFEGTAGGHGTPAWDVQVAGSGELGDKPSLMLTTLTGKVEALPILLSRPPTLSWNEHGISVTPFALAIGDGVISGKVESSAESTDLVLDLAALPADLLAIFQPQIHLEGHIAGQLALRDRGDGARGTANISLTGMRFLDTAFKAQTPVHGNLQLRCAPGHLTVAGVLEGLDSNPSKLSAEIPLTIGMRHPSLHIAYDAPLTGQLDARGHLAPFLQPLMVDTNRIRGQVVTQLQLSGTWSKPELRGRFLLKNGTYESLFTGTTFNNVQADFVADGREVTLKSLSASSGKNGQLTGTGTLNLHPAERFPFSVSMEVTSTEVVKVDHLAANVTGKLLMEGNLDRARISGKVTLDEAHIHIPNQIPKEIYTLDVIFVNDDAEPTDTVTLSQKHRRLPSYPVYFDVAIDASKNLYLNGRGLTTEWGGKVALKGTTSQPQLFGGANLIRGDFLMAGTVSPISQGFIYMNGAPREITVSLSCDLEVGDVFLPLTLSGPIHQLQIEGLTELSRVDALLLAQAAMRLTGGQVAPDLLEDLRHRTGLDLLDVGTVGESDDRQFTIQVGKYFRRGISVSVARTMAREGARTALDVSLTKNLKVRAEVADVDDTSSDQREIKLLLKWKHDY